MMLARPLAAAALFVLSQLGPASAQPAVADTARERYADLAGDAGERLSAAAAWLRARDYARIAVVSHSMGAAMVDAWLAHDPPPSIDAWVPVGMWNAFARPPREPVLDVVAERDFPDVLTHSKMRAAKLPDDRCSGARVVAGTDHYFGDAAKRLTQEIVPFLARALARQC